MPERTLLRGFRLVDPVAGHDGTTDVLVEDGLVAAVGPGLAADGAEVVDGDGLVLTPGLVDLHAHLREPGFEQKETIETGTRAAAAGGYTAVVAMPNTDPVTDNVAVIAEVRARATAAALCEVFPAGSITRGLEGESLTDIGEMAAAGVRLLTDDGNCVGSSRVMRLALEYARPFGVLIAQHPQDAGLSEGWQMHEGHYSALLGLTGVPAEAEEVVVARDLALARLTGGRLHVMHASSARTVAMVREAKAEGLRVSAEVTPHHLTLSDEDLVTYDPNRRINPPVRTPEHRDGLRAGLADGTLDAVATDHAPHAAEEKEREFDLAPPGTIGLETAFAVVHTELVATGVLTLSELIERMSSRPAALLGLDGHGGPVIPGRPANLAAFDLTAEWTAGERPFRSLAANSAFLGRRLRGRPVHTILGGRFTLRDGEATA